MSESLADIIKAANTQLDRLAIGVSLRSLRYNIWKVNYTGSPGFPLTIPTSYYLQPDDLDMGSQGWELVTSGVVYFDPNGKPDAPTEPSTPSLPSEPLA